MKELLKVSGGKLELDEKNKRLVMTVSNASQDQFTQIMDRSVQAVKEHGVKECLVDVKNREGASSDTSHYAVKQCKESMKQGLKRMALVLPSSDNDKKIANQFVSEMSSDQVRSFSSRQEASQWLDSSAGQQRRAA